MQHGGEGTRQVRCSPARRPGAVQMGAFRTRLPQGQSLKEGTAASSVKATGIFFLRSSALLCLLVPIKAAMKIALPFPLPSHHPLKGEPPPRRAYRHRAQSLLLHLPAGAGARPRSHLARGLRFLLALRGTRARGLCCLVERHGGLYRAGGCCVCPFPRGAGFHSHGVCRLRCWGSRCWFGFRLNQFLSKM